MRNSTFRILEDFANLSRVGNSPPYRNPKRWKGIAVTVLILLILWDGADRFFLIQRIKRLEDGICKGEVFSAYVEGVKAGLHFQKNHGKIK